MATAETIGAFKSKIAPELQALARPIEDATPHPDNARKHNLPKIARSLNDHGQRAAIVVQSSTGYIVKGNGTWTAASTILGWTEIAQSWQDLSDDEALAFLLADNKASDESTYDTPKLVKALSKLAEGPGLMDSLWAAEELEDLIEASTGPTILDGPVTAEYNDAGAEQLSGRGYGTAGGGTKHKEVPLLLTPADHAEFMERIAVLKQRYGTTKTVVAIMEAVKRQADAEEGAERLGRDVDAEAIPRLRREWAVEVRNLLMTDPRYEELTRPKMLGLLEHFQPYVATSPLRQSEVAEGQVAAFPDLEEPEAAEVQDPAEVVVDPEHVPTSRELGNAPDQAEEYEAAQAEALARYRKRS